MNIIQVENLNKIYKKAEEKAVDDISFNVKKGDFFAFLGPNGAGKTTTISILTTTLLQTTGTVTIAGFDVAKTPNKVRELVGIIFQNPSLDLNLTAEENIRLHANMYNVFPYRPTYKMMPSSYKKRLEEVAKILNIQKDLFNPVKTFSGGMKRKLEIVRSLIHEPEILFLDEPTTGLDPKARKDLWAYLKKIQLEKGLTIFLTTHYLDEAESADKMAVISKGKIIYSGSPKKLKNDLLNNFLILKPNLKFIDKLKIELNSKDINYNFKDNVFSLDIEKGSVQTIIKQIDTPIEFIDIKIPSLEEAYLKLINK